MTTKRSISFLRFLWKEPMIYFTKASAFWRAIPNFKPVFSVFEMLSKFLFAGNKSVADNAVKIIRLPRYGVFKVILYQTSRDPTMVLQLIFLLHYLCKANSNTANGDA